MLTLGTTIRRLRTEANLTQEQLATRAGISTSYLSHIESDRREPRIEILRRLSAELPVWPGLLLGALVQTEMPEELHPAFEGFVEDVLRATDSTQLALPLESESNLATGTGNEMTHS